MFKPKFHKPINEKAQALERIVVILALGVAFILIMHLAFQRIEQYVCLNASISHAQELGCFEDGLR